MQKNVILRSICETEGAWQYAKQFLFIDERIIQRPNRNECEDVTVDSSRSEEARFTLAHAAVIREFVTEYVWLLVLPRYFTLRRARRASEVDTVKASNESRRRFVSPLFALPAHYHP